MNVIRPKVFRKAESVVAAVSTREGGESGAALGMNLSYDVGDRPEDVKANRDRFFGSLSIAPAELAIPQQVHSATVKRVSAPGNYPECDALISNARRLFLCVSVADCVPILLYEPDTPAVGIVHAGWRGTLARITSAAVASMMREFSSSPPHVLAYLGPSAGVCCYTVGEEVASQFDSRFIQRHTPGVSLDLKAANVAQLEELGIPPENIEVSPYCSISEPLLFHSYRRDGKSSGRMMGVIGLL